MGKKYYKKDSGPPKHIIYGVHPVVEAVQAEQSIDKLLLRQGTLHHSLSEVKGIAKARNIPIQYVPDEKLDQLSRYENHQGVVAMLAAFEYKPLEQLILSLKETEDRILLVMLDNVTDVRNFGAIARTAECLGVNGVIIPAKGSAAGNAMAVKVSAGALSHIPVSRVDNLIDATMLLQAYEIPVIACSEKGETSVFNSDLRGDMCLVLGSEEKGISPKLLKRADEHLSIPMLGNIESLNVSVAAGILMSEAVRQYRKSKKLL